MELIIRFVITVCSIAIYYYGQTYLVLEMAPSLSETLIPPSPFFHSNNGTVTLFQFGLLPYFVVTALTNIIFLINKRLKSIPETRREKLIERWTLISAFFVYTLTLILFITNQPRVASPVRLENVSMYLFFGILVLLALIVILNKAGMGNNNGLSLLIITTLLTNIQFPSSIKELLLATLVILFFSLVILWGETKYFNLKALAFNNSELKTALTSTVQHYPTPLNKLGLLPLLGLTIIDSFILSQPGSFQIIILNGLLKLFILSIILFFVNQLVAQFPKVTLTFSNNSLTFSNLYPGRQTLKCLVQKNNTILVYNILYIFFIFQTYSLLHWLLDIKITIPVAGLFIIIKTLTTIFIQAQQYTISGNVVHNKIPTL